jgi:hypothetical protein
MNGYCTACRGSPGNWTCAGSSRPCVPRASPVVIDARFFGGPLDGEHQALPEAYREYLIPISVDPLAPLDSYNLPVTPVHVYRLARARPDNLHDYLYEGLRDA